MSIITVASCVFGVIYEIIIKSDVMKFPSSCFLLGVRVSGLIIFRSLIHFELIFVYGPDFFLFRMAMQFSPHSLLKRLSPLCSFGTLVEDRLTVSVRGSSVGLYVYQYASTLMFSLLWFVIQFEVENVRPPNLFFFKIVLAV